MWWEASGQFQSSALRRPLPGFFLSGSACPHFAHDPRLPQFIIYREISNYCAFKSGIWFICWMGHGM